MYREIFRLNQSELKNTPYLIFKAKKEILSVGYKEIETDVLDVLRKENVVN
jgi:hypothetical protein